MRATDILKAIQKLNPSEKHRLREYLIDALTSSSLTGTVLDEISERKNKDGYRCPDCESEHIVRFEKYSTIVDGEELKKQRFRCKACRMTFTDLTNTALYRTRHLNRWMKFIECMIEGYSLRKSAELIGGVTHVTLFYWRHKLLSALKQLESLKFQGIVEMDETYFTKYLNNYLAWFQVLESIHHQRNEVTMNDMIIKGNLIPSVETYDTLRLSKFTV